MRSRGRKIVSIITVLMMIISLFPTATLAQSGDVAGHWAEQEISKWQEKGLVNGYPDGSFRPDHYIKRAEFFKLINDMFGYEEQDELNFTDTSTSDWFYDEIAKASAAGYVSGYSDGTIRPDNYITRAEAVVVIVNTFGWSELISSSAHDFVDVQNIAGWARNQVGIAKDKGIISGYPDGSFGSNNPIKRGEAIKMLDQASGDIYHLAGTYRNAVQENVIVNTAGVTLENVVINGDLYLAEGIGDGEVVIESVTVKGKTFVKGGGENSIILKNSSLNDIEVNKPLASGQQVRIVSEGNTSVSGTVNVYSGMKLEEIDITEGADGFTNVTISEELSDTASVQLAGEFNEVIIDSNVTVAINSESSIHSMRIQASADITISEDAEVEEITISESANGLNLEVHAEVSIEINADNIRINDQPVEKGDIVEISAEGNIVITAPTDDDSTSASPPSSTGGGNGGDDDGNDEDTEEDTEQDTEDDTDEEETPTVSINDIEDVTLVEGQETVIEVSTSAEDVTIRASSSDENVATVTVIGTNLTISGVSMGTSKISVYGNQDGFQEGVRAFDVTVNPDQSSITATLEGGGTFLEGHANSHANIHVSGTDAYGDAIEDLSGIVVRNGDDILDDEEYTIVGERIQLFSDYLNRLSNEENPITITIQLNGISDTIELTVEVDRSITATLLSGNYITEGSVTEPVVIDISQTDTSGNEVEPDLSTIVLKYQSSALVEETDYTVDDAANTLTLLPSFLNTLCCNDAPYTIDVELDDLSHKVFIVNSRAELNASLDSGGTFVEGMADSPVVISLKEMDQQGDEVVYPDLSRIAVKQGESTLTIGDDYTVDDVLNTIRILETYLNGLNSDDSPVELMIELTEEGLNDTIELNVATNQSALTTEIHSGGSINEASAIAPMIINISEVNAYGEHIDDPDLSDVVVKNGESTLSIGDDYTVDDAANTIRILETYLNNLSSIDSPIEFTIEITPDGLSDNVVLYVEDNAVKRLEVDKVSATSITLSWWRSEVESPDELEMYISDNEGESYVLANYDDSFEDMKMEKEVTITGLQSDTTYYFKLIVIGGKNSGTSNVVEGTTGPPLFAGGTGTEGDPYLITNATHLNNIRQELTSHFKLDNDIDLDVSPFNTGAGWEPIGDYKGKFSGTLDGNGHTISNLFIDRSSNVGLFNEITGTALIKNVILQDVEITGTSSRVAALTGTNLGVVENSSVNGGTIRGNESVGALVGNNAGTITNSSVTAAVYGSAYYAYAGGLAGVNNGTIEFSYAYNGSVETTVTEDTYAEGLGGLVGYNSANIANSYATDMLIHGEDESNQSAATGVGGLVGINNEGTVEDSYAAASSIIGLEDVGGLIGQDNNGTITNSYYDQELSGLSDIGKGVPKTTAEMKTESTYEGWDFEAIWGIETDQYPHLK